MKDLLACMAHARRKIHNVHVRHRIRDPRQLGRWTDPTPVDDPAL